MATSIEQSDHPFIASPHKTILTLSFPVLFSLIAEPLTGLVDTAFIARLGAEELAALGVGTVVLSSLFWIFNFLGIGAQTEVAQASGRQDHRHTMQINGLAVLISGVSGILLILVGIPLSPFIASVLGATEAIMDSAVEYLTIRWFGAPAVLITATVFGTLRGLQDMHTPLWIALAINLINILLDGLLIFGYGPVPAMGIAGAAVASVISQWIGAIWVLIAVFKRLGFPKQIPWSHLNRLIAIGGDLFIRTGLLNAFLVLTTRAATRNGADSGAAHQAIRQVWMFTTLILDAYAVTGQSLVAYFIGTNQRAVAKKVASVICGWGIWTGAGIGVLMWFGEDFVARILVPATAIGYFSSAWFIALVIQPVNSLAFTTDGVHWGTGDFRYLRNGVLAATSIGTIGIILLNDQDPDALTQIWIISAIWITIRAFFGVARIWPGFGDSPLSHDNKY